MLYHFLLVGTLRPCNFWCLEPFSIRVLTISNITPFLSKLSRLLARFKLRRGFSPRTVKTSGNGRTRLPYWFALHQMLNFNVLRYSEVRKLHLNIQYKSRIGRRVKLTNHDKRWKQTMSQIFADDFTFDFTATASNFWQKQQQEFLVGSNKADSP